MVTMASQHVFRPHAGHNGPTPNTYERPSAYAFDKACAAAHGRTAMNDMAEVSLASLELPPETDIASPQSGTRALMLAVLEDAILNLGSSVGRNRAEAERWIMSPERQHVFSFAVICETLDFAPSAVRRSLMRLISQKPRSGRLLKRARPNVRHTEALELYSTRGKAL